MSNFIKLSIASVIAFVSLATICSGSLVWESRRIETTALLDQTTVIVDFRFKNAGSATEIITSARPSCTCTRAELAKEIYAPGESGDVKVTFDIGERTGINEKTIEITTLDKPKSPDVLLLRVTVPEKFKIDQTIIWWSSSETPQEVSSVLIAAPEVIISSVEIKSVNEQIESRVETAEPGHRYRLLFKATNADIPMRVTIPCVVHYANGHESSFTLYALRK